MGTIPIGDVDFCEQVLNNRLFNYPIDFYPDFLSSYISRKIGYSAFGFVEASQYKSSRRLFIKPAKIWKSDFTSRVVEPNEEVPLDWYYWSEVVDFVQEWRYYVADGKVITSGWYAGNDEDEESPTINISYPTSFVGRLILGGWRMGD